MPKPDFLLLCSHVADRTIFVWLLFTSLLKALRVQADSNDTAARPVELLQGPVLPRAVTQQTTMLSPYGILRGPTRHFFSDG
jgi:hypothetical protein